MRWRAISAGVALLASACLGSPPDAGEAEPDALPGCPSVGQLADGFDQENPDLWQEFGIEDCDLRVAGRLEVDSAAACGLASAGCYDLSDRWVEVDAVRPGRGLRFELHLKDFGDDLVMTVDAEQELVIEQVDPDGVGHRLTSLPFDPEVHQLWRMLHSATENRVTFETSRRAEPSWARLAELFLDGVSVRQVEVRLGAADSDGMVAFDSLRGVDL